MMRDAKANNAKILTRFLPASIDAEMSGEVSIHFGLGSGRFWT
jgi:hypothetical protein